MPDRPTVSETPLENAIKSIMLGVFFLVICILLLKFGWEAIDAIFN